MPRQHHQLQREEAGGKAVWDTGSSLYDSYELAAVQRVVDRRLLAGVRPLPDDPPPAPVERRRDEDESKQQVVVIGGAHRAGGKKMTLRALFRAAASWVIRPRRAHACTCVGVAHVGAVEPLVPSHGKV